MDVTERKPLTRSKIGVLMGGQSSEREVSLKTGDAVYRSLVRSGYDAVAIDVGPALTQTMQEQVVEIAFSGATRSRRRGRRDSRVLGDAGHSLYGIRGAGECDRYA